MHISISHVRKHYRRGTLALDDLNLELGPGMFGLLGPNGAGKTTLMRIMATLLEPSAGDVLVDGVSVRRQPREVRRMLGYLPQQFSTYPELSVAEFLDYFALLSGLGPERRAIIDDLLERVNLQQQRHKRSNQLSGGMQRRLGIAQALLNNPRLLIVDEPTAGLDPEERVRFRNLLAGLSDDRVILLSTHIVEDIASTCADLAVLQAGRLRFRGAPAALARAAAGKAWNATLSREELKEAAASAAVVRSVRSGDNWRVRLLAEQQPAGGVQPATPTIEDGYMYLMQKETA